MTLAASMRMAPAVRKFALTVHVSCSVGWLGSVGAFLALAIAGVASDDPHTPRSTYPAMALITSYVIVPLSLGSLLTGVVQALGTKWGLFKHYWVIAKLAITVVASVILFVHTRPIDAMATVAARRALSSAEFRRLRVQLVADASAALIALATATALTVYKPRGVTAYGRRQTTPNL
jgi:hypothetical protein